MVNYDAGSETDRRNAAVEAGELAHWATGPAHMIGYVTLPAFEIAWAEKFRDKDGNTLLPSGQWTSAAGKDMLLRGFPRAVITTWRGTPLAHGHLVSVYRAGFARTRMVSVRVTGTNGYQYTGRCGIDGGNAIHLRRRTR